MKPLGVAQVACAIAVLAAATAAASCRQVVGIESSPGSALDASASVIDASSGGACSAGGDACHACLATSCCDELTRCGLDSNCKASYDCVVACGATDEACRSRCVHGFGAPLAEALSCRARACSPACGVVCGGILGVVMPETTAVAPGCAACAHAKACDALGACAGDPGCVRFAACQERSCSPLDMSCVSGCKHPVGPSAAGDTVRSALGTYCDAECRTGTNWDCVGQRSWPLGPPGPVTFSAHLQDLLTAKPVSGASVRSCSLASSTCPPGTELGSGTSDANGYGSAPAGSVTLPGYLGAYIEITESDGFTVLVYAQPPLTGSVVGSPRYTPQNFFVVTKTDLALLGTTLTLDPARGHALLLIGDCGAVQASGIQFEVSGGTLVYVSTSAGGFNPGPTDKSGLAAAFNVPPGLLTVNAKIAATGRLVAQGSAFIRAGAVTQLTLAALPP